MATYLLRRLLLFVPTLIGATMLVFFVVASAPGGIAAFALSQTGDMRPEERKYKMEYLKQRYGLDQPLMVQYLRWLNKVSPVGFRTWQMDDPAVKDASAREAKEHEAIRPQVVEQVRAQYASQPLTATDFEQKVDDELRRRVDLKPDAGDTRFNRPAIKKPDFGDSFARGRKVGDLIAEAMPITLLLQAIAIPIEYFIAIITGIWAAKHRGKFLDMFSGTFTLALWSLPVIWVAVLMIGFLANNNYLGWFPPNGLTDVTTDSMAFLPRTEAGQFQRGFLLDFGWHLVLPLICIAYANIAFLHKLTRASLLETIQADFVRTARAKGLNEKVVLYAHAFRNSLIPLITVAAHLLPAMITGAIIVETVFGINGMGKLTYEGITQRDRELFLSNTLIFVTLGMVGTLLADLCNVLADPRVSYDQ